MPHVLDRTNEQPTEEGFTSTYHRWAEPEAEETAATVTTAWLLVDFDEELPAEERDDLLPEPRSFEQSVAAMRALPLADDLVEAEYA